VNREHAFARDYTPPLLAYLARADEPGLSAAYELGRRALQAGIGLLVLVRIHHQAIREVLATAQDAHEAQELITRASAFLLEALAPFEMTQRGFMAGDALTARETTPRPAG